VTYIATDCAGNSSTATSTLVVQDLEPPLVTAPAPLTVYTAVNNCLATVGLPFPAVSENCALTQDSVFSPLTLVKFETDPNLPSQLVPKDVTLTIPGVVPNAVSGAKLLILNRGDNANPGEFYRVFDESNVLLTVTTPGLASDECTAFNEKPISITPAQLNPWAANGSVAVRLRANRLASSPDWINPCGPLAPDQSDGISQVQAVLVYDYAAVQYTVTNSGGMVVASGALTGSQSQVTLPPGLYTVAYRVTDAAGIEGMTTFNVTVRDTVAPQAVCQPVITIFTNPSGFVPYILQPAELNNNSTDNCTPAAGLQFQLSQTSFNCPSQPNQSTLVALTVRDSSGNTDVCSTLVVIKTVALSPTYDPVCVGGELKLHANAPPPPGGYSYSWQKTGGTPYTSTASDPSINPATSGYQGLYNVTVTGATGCSSIGSVVVTFHRRAAQPLGAGAGVRRQQHHLVNHQLPGFQRYLFVVCRIASAGFPAGHHPDPGIYLYAAQPRHLPVLRAGRGQQLHHPGIQPEDRHGKSPARGHGEQRIPVGMQLQPHFAGYRGHGSGYDLPVDRTGQL
jgi:hypothetical protein